jgi:hypothetical protein
MSSRARRVKVVPGMKLLKDTTEDPRTLWSTGWEFPYWELATSTDPESWGLAVRVDRQRAEPWWDGYLSFNLQFGPWYIWLVRHWSRKVPA